MEEADFYITDMQGRIVSDLMHLNAGEKQSISLSGFIKGMYLLQSAGAVNYSYRFIVHH